MQELRKATHDDSGHSGIGPGEHLCHDAGLQPYITFPFSHQSLQYQPKLWTLLLQLQQYLRYNLLRDQYRNSATTVNMGFMDRAKHSKLYNMWLRFTRVLQFLSAAISLGIFSGRIYKVIKLYRRINKSSGAVEGILAAAVAYTILATILQVCLRRTGSHKILRWLLIVLDILFVAAFIVVAVLTAPNGPSGPCRASTLNNIQHPTQYQTANCKLPWGTFILAIVST